MKDREYQEQCVLFEWADYMSHKIPELKLLHASANGGKRNIITATRLKKSGVRSGIPDIFLPVPRGCYHGLFLEMKVKGNYLTENQKDWLRRLSEQDYQTAVCYGWQEAKETIEKYLALKPEGEKA